jgi:hypothetical protein
MMRPFLQAALSPSVLTNTIPAALRFKSGPDAAYEACFHNLFLHCPYILHMDYFISFEFRSFTLMLWMIETDCKLYCQLLQCSITSENLAYSRSSEWRGPHYPAGLYNFVHSTFDVFILQIVHLRHIQLLWVTILQFLIIKILNIRSPISSQSTPSRIWIQCFASYLGPR